MFPKIIDNGKGKKYMYLVESYRNKNGTPSHKVIASLGSLDGLYKKDNYKRLLKSFSKLAPSKKDQLYDLDSAKELGRLSWGISSVIKKLWQTFNLDELLSDISQDTKIKFNLYEPIFLMLADRFASPSSKYRTFLNQDKYNLETQVDLHKFYRSLDVLAQKKDSIEKALFLQNRKKFNMSVKVVFYDVTTLYFESVHPDELRKFGYSKDGKSGEVQVMVGLIVNSEGRPVGYEVFPGNFYEGNTLNSAINKLKNKFKIDKLVFIADRGMLSSKNIELIRSSGYEYIIGARIKSKPKDIKENILDLSSYEDISPEGEVLKIKTVDKYNKKVREEVNQIIADYGINEDSIKQIGSVCKSLVQGTLDVEKIRDRLREKLILTYSSRRSVKNRADRERLLEKAKEALKKGGLSLKNKGYMKYITAKLDCPSLDMEKVVEEEKWDGYYGIDTNSKELRSVEISNYYHMLWKVEESFRLFKTHLETRPIYHRSESRIRGHLMLCFLALVLERHLEKLLSDVKIEYSSERVREAINSLEVTKLEVEGEIFYLRSKVGELAEGILKVLKINIPPNIVKSEKFDY